MAKYLAHKFNGTHESQTLWPRKRKIAMVWGFCGLLWSFVSLVLLVRLVKLQANTWKMLGRKHAAVQTQIVDFSSSRSLAPRRLRDWAFVLGLGVLFSYGRQNPQCQNCMIVHFSKISSALSLIALNMKNVFQNKSLQFFSILILSNSQTVASWGHKGEIHCRNNSAGWRFGLGVGVDERQRQRRGLAHRTGTLVDGILDSWINKKSILLKQKCVSRTYWLKLEWTYSSGYEESCALTWSIHFELLSA